MKSKLKSAVLVLGFMSMTSFVGMALALSDIYHDYLSPKQLSSLAIDRAALPDWTLCQLEWSMVVFSLFVTFAFFLTADVYLVKKHRPVPASQA